MDKSTDPRDESIGIIGAGAAGLITAQTLLRDGFRNVELLTRDKTVGGVWAAERVYPGLLINNVHGEFRFSSMPMPPPSNAEANGGRLSGDDMRAYMETFAARFVKDNVRCNTKVFNIRRDETSMLWMVSVVNTKTGNTDVLKYSRIVLCTGGCSEPFIPDKLSPYAAKCVDFAGPVLHSTSFRSELHKILSNIKPASQTDDAIVVVGGGKSAQDIAAYLANKGRRVSVVFDTADSFMAVSRPLPDFIRKSRFLGILSPHIELRTRLERFLHQTWLGSEIVKYFWTSIAEDSFNALEVPQDSPLRNTHSLFWGIRTNDEGVGRPDGFFSLVNQGKITLVAPTHAEGFGEDGQSLVLSNGDTIRADAVILATGYSSSWRNIFDEKTADELGISRHAPKETIDIDSNWDYASLANPPPAHPNSQQWASSIYRGLVPAKNINRRDFAINGAVFTTNNGYFYEVSSHWISSYFLGDKMRLPSSPEEAYQHTERVAAWMRKRFPDMLLWTNESYSSGLNFWTWPQAVDELLDDMELPSLRSGGNWLTWPFKVIDLREISTLKEERDAKRNGV